MEVISVSLSFAISTKLVSTKSRIVMKSLHTAITRYSEIQLMERTAESVLYSAIKI